MTITILADLIAIEGTPDRAICERSAQAGYVVYRSPRFPTYYGGNGLLLERAGPSLAEWEAVHARHFPPAVYRHRTFTFGEGDAFRPLAAAAARRYHCACEVFLHLTDAPAAAPSLDGDVALRRLESEADWAEMKRFDDAQHREEDWYEDGDDMLHRKDRVIAAAIGMRWHFLADRDGRMVAKTGSFVHGGTVSLQDVTTATLMRRRGLATFLVGAVIEAYRAAGYRHFSLSADKDDDAIRIYRRLGFREVGCRFTMMTYPGIVVR